MPLVQGRKRRAQTQEDDEDVSSPEQSPEPQTQRRRTQNNNDDEDGAFANDNGATQNSSTDELAKKLVRLALACEYGRKPIRRQEINEKVLGSSSGGRAKLFNNVFSAAQRQLGDIFGMAMVELPAREKITLQQRRAAQKKDSQSQSKATTGSWCLTNLLPEPFRDPAILALPAAPTSAIDADYTGIYTTLVSLIMLSGGQLPDTKMDRYLRKLGIDDRTPVPGYEKNEQLMKRLEKDGYLYKIKENTGMGEEDTYYVAGPRGRIEVGEAGTRGLVRMVMAPDGEDDEVELDNKVMRSLGVAVLPPTARAGTQQQNGGAAQKRGRKRKSNEQEEEEEEEDDDDESEDE